VLGPKKLHGPQPARAVKTYAPLVARLCGLLAPAPKQAGPLLRPAAAPVRWPARQPVAYPVCCPDALRSWPRPSLPSLDLSLSQYTVRSITDIVLPALDLP
jgi:hypothetical protein